jgi:hypothetical protein
MRVIARICFTTMLVLGLSGCYSIVAMPDIATATVYGPHLPIRTLTPTQVLQLSNWMKAHDAGWHGLMETPPTSPAMTIVMHEPNSQQSYVDVFRLKDGGAMMYFYATRPRLPVKRYVSEADLAALWEAVRN